MSGFLARISARRPWTTIGVWIVLVATGAVLIQTMLEGATTTEMGLSGRAESEVAARLLRDELRGPKPMIELIVIQADSLTVDSAAFREKVESVSRAILSLGSGVVATGTHYYQARDETLVSRDRKTTIVQMVMAGDFDEAASNVGSVLEVVADADAEEEFRVLVGGAASIAFETNELSRQDLEQGERFGLPVALIILLVLFGSVVAALLPIGLAIVAIIVALGLVAVIGQAFQLVFFVTMMVSMIGMAVGIDYSLLIASRFREEMNRGLGRLDAVIRAGETAGRAVMFSGITTIVALCGMLIVPAEFFRSLGIGAILVVMVALGATMTLLPATLALLGPRIDRLRIPFARRRTDDRAHGSSDGFWGKTTRLVTKFPIVSILAVGGPMVACTLFYLQIETGINGLDTFPEGAQTKEAFFVLEEEFSFGLVNPAEIVIRGDLDSPQVQASIASLETSLTEDGRFPIAPVTVHGPSGDLALMTLPLPGEPRSHTTVEAVAVLREQYIPSAFDGVSVEVFVGGETAGTADLFAVVHRYTPIVFGFVLGLSFIVLLLVFRSIVVPIKAVFMNLLSVGTAYGLMVLVFQKGVATDLLGFQHAEVIDVWIPLFLFAIVFGLSMDYHVFLLSRIRERYDETGDNADAVAYGLRSTAGIITGAALIMVAVFGAFASGKTIINQQVGFGLAVAVLLDATLVRSILVPATMEILGKGNWYLPAWLGWLPEVRVEPPGDRT